MHHTKVSLKEVTLVNDWFFGKVMSDPEICRLFLEKLLCIRIRKLELVNSQQAVASQFGAKGIRLDVYVEDDQNTVYDIEIQLRNQEIPKRSRYYQSNLDMNHLRKGESY